jgi:hypothetical protein
MLEKIPNEKVTFLREQQGLPESQLIARLKREVFPNAGIDRAYLVQVAYPHGGRGVALCLSGVEDRKEEIATGIAGIFHEMFNDHMHLDIIFLEPAQEAEVNRVCRTFFVAK